MLVTRFFFVGPLPDVKHLIGHVSVLSTLMYIYSLRLGLLLYYYNICTGIVGQMPQSELVSYTARE